MWLAADAGTQCNRIFGMIWPFVLMFAVLYFLLIRPQQKKQKTRSQMLDD